MISTALTRLLLERGQDEITHYNRGETEQRVRGNFKTIHGNREHYAEFESQMLELDNFDCVIDMVGYHPADAESVVRAFRGRVGHYIFCSTIDVYTKPARSYPIKEDADRSGTFEGYPRDKMLCENILLAAHDPQSFPVTIIRLGATYGDSRGFVHSLGGDTTYIDRLRKGKPIIVHSDGTSIWVNCHVDDVSRAFIGAMGNPRAFGKAYGSCLQPSRTRPRRSRPPGRAAH